MVRELRTVLESDGTPELELAKEEGKLVIYEADNMNRQGELSVDVIPALIRALEELK